MPLEHASAKFNVYDYGWWDSLLPAIAYVHVGL